MIGSEASQPAKNLLAILVIASACTLVLFVTYSITSDPVAGNIIEKKMASIEPVIPQPYDNDISNDYITVTAPEHLGTDQPVNIFRARYRGSPTGLVFMPVNTRGYGGTITLATGIYHDGRIASIQVINHSETKGIGDKIDQENSGWLQIFRNRSLANTPVEAWDIRQNGGAYDQISGATITSRSVINAVRKSLEYYKVNRDRLYD